MVKCQENDMTIVYSPRCKPLVQFTKKDLFGMYECLKELLKVGVIHRDLSYNHFMKSMDNDEIVLIDFGCALIMPQPNLTLNHSNLGDDNTFYTYQGSIEFAALEVLEHLKDPLK
jgi:serine/threonine protein kinase